MPVRPRIAIHPVIMPQTLTDLTPDFPLYLDKDALQPLETAARINPAGLSIAQRVALAWHLRQRDTHRALALADEAAALLNAAGDAPSLPQLQARLALLRAESSWLFGDFSSCEHSLQQALSAFTQLGDPAGEGDCRLLAVQLAWDKGEAEARRQLQAACQRCYDASGDPCRQAAILAWTAYFASFERDIEPTLVLEHWQHQHPGIGLPAGFLLFCRAFVACSAGQYHDAAMGWEDAATLLQQYGLIRLAITCLNNASTAAGNLSEYERESLLAEHALSIALPRHWPFSMGQSLRSLGESMRAVGNFSSALQIYEEAASWLTALNRSWLYAVVTFELAVVQMHEQQLDAAQQSLALSEAAIHAGGHMGLLPVVLARRAQALSQSGQHRQALEIAQQALTASEQGYYGAQDTVLEVLAEIHLRHRFPGSTLSPSPALHYLDRFLALKQKDPTYVAEPSLLARYAQAWEQLGNLSKAIEYERKRSEMLERHGNQKAMDRVKALQVSNEAEKAKLAAEHQKALADAEKARALALEASTNTLLALSNIGQEITRCLDSERVFDALSRHVADMLDCQLVQIYQLNEEDGTLDMIIGLLRGEPLPYLSIPLDSPISDTALCVRQQREILRHIDPEQEVPNRFPGPRRIRTTLFAPLCAEGKVLGAMSIQSEQANAYGEVEQMVFRTLCAYGAIALNNAKSYRTLDATLRELTQTQAQLVHQEKMASLGTLTAGIAHEINNPANFAHVGAQSLAIDLERFRSFLLDLAGEDAPANLLQSLNKRIDALIDQSRTIIEGTTRIGNLVKDLRTFARLDEAERKVVNIGDCLQSTLNLVSRHLAPIMHIDSKLDYNPHLECWPAQLSQVFMNLVTNAAQAIQSRRHNEVSPPPGLLTIRSLQDGDYLRIVFEDNGCGMSPQVVRRIFEPFYTTKPVGEGTGLGLSISFGIVERHRGTILVESQEGLGSRFVVKLPVYLS
ncbi:ATP-binding protein [Parachitinimonas caeni]|uniref:histidine kinase n=1 Tax=Parachitinimonas caeni TaxID=3031301 RepID=A0ABT7DYT8_9NEIS|nr:ATP-binding protein [Parachitinimonas caeni]MDK2125223.1 ATP-binding protein [Parachitinimonas caeni]